jgi:hypothetical protein
MRTPFITAALCSGVMLASAGCRGESKTTPAAEATVQTPVTPQNQPMTVTGCLRAGEAADTFVLTTAQTRDSAETATYQLTGAQGVNLRDHVGRQVEVSGVVRSEQEIASASPTTEADRAKGTSGTPTVQTRTNVQIRRLDVSSLKPAGGQCE